MKLQNCQLSRSCIKQMCEICKKECYGCDHFIEIIEVFAELIDD